jgi:glyoxylate reductase
MPHTPFKVFVTRRIPEIGPQLLKDSGFAVSVHEGAGPMSALELDQAAAKSDALLCTLMDQIDAGFIKRHSHLKVISNFAVGHNNIDLKAASAFNILVGNTPDVLTEATAEIAFGLMIASARNFHPAQLHAREGHWKYFEPLGFLGQSLRGKTLGIVGMGRIGCRLAEMAQGAFAMKILSLKSSDSRTTFEELLRSSDFISIHTPLTEKTRNLISTNEFSLMKKNCVLINTSRGEVIDQEALYEALNSQRIFAAGLDVTTPEPLAPDHKLYSLPNVYILPHIGSATIEARNGMSLKAAENIVAALTGKMEIGHFVN